MTKIESRKDNEHKAISDIEFLHYIAANLPRIVKDLVQATWHCGYLTAKLEQQGMAGINQRDTSNQLKDRSEEQLEKLNLLNSMASQLEPTLWETVHSLGEQEQ